MTKWVAKWVVAWTLISVLALALTAVWCGITWCGPWFPERAAQIAMTLWAIMISYAVVQVTVVALARAVRNDKKRPPKVS